jgi:sulfide:quinone oxidoreductase
MTKMGKQILITGAGFGGLETATSLREKLDDSFNITLIDKNDFFIIGFTKFDVMFGRRSAEEVKSYYKNLAAKGINFVQDTVERIDPGNKIVKTSSADFTYDFLVVALGADLAPEAIPGFIEGGHEFYSLQGAQRLYPLIENLSSGTILISIFSKPYKCPPAPYEAAFQLHDFFINKGVRDNINIKVLIPGPMPLPVSKNVSAEIEKLLNEKNIKLFKRHKVVEINPDKKTAIIEDREPMSYDLFLGVPVHRPPKIVRESVLGKTGWITVNKTNLETGFKNVYAVGDVTNIPVGEFAVPKAGAFAEDAAKVVVNDILNKIKNESNVVKFDAVGTCYIEAGAGNVAELKANFLGNPEPRLTLNGPSLKFRENKESFEEDRISKWFKERD